MVRKRDLKCVYCGIEFNSSYKSRQIWEHIINDIRINGPENISFCCGSCNASKGSKRLEDWLKSNYCNRKGITINSVASVVQKHFDNSK